MRIGQKGKACLRMYLSRVKRQKLKGTEPIEQFNCFISQLSNSRLFNSKTLKLIFVFSLFISPGYAVSNAGTTGASFLELGIGAKSAAMGEANTAWSDDVYGMYFNPAGIARIRRQQLGFAYNTMYIDLDYNYIGYAYPIKNYGTLAISGIFVDLGTVDRTTIASGTANTVLGKADASDISVSLTYAHALMKTLDIGVTLKLVHEKLDRYSATAGAVDIGLLWHLPVNYLTAGISISNLGSRLQFVRESEELPLTMRMGLAYRNPSRIWGAAADIVWVNSQDIEAKFGGEIWIWPRHLALRIGVNTANDLSKTGITAGAGFEWEDIGLDYAYVPYGELGEEHLASLTVQFGKEREPFEWERRKDAIKKPEIEIYSVTAPMVVTVETVQAEVKPEQVEIQLPPVVQRKPLLGKIYVAPFRYSSGPEQLSWMSDATVEVFKQDWMYIDLADDPRDALYILLGEVQVSGDEMTVTANLIKYSEEIARFRISGNAERPFEVWDRLLIDVNNKLKEEGEAEGLSTDLPVNRRRFSGREI